MTDQAAVFGLLDIDRDARQLPRAVANILYHHFGDTMTGYGQEADFLDCAGKIARDRATNVCITVLKRSYIDNRDT